MRTIIAIVTVLAVLALLGNSFGPHVHLHGFGPLMGNGIVEGLIAVAASVFAVAITIGILVMVGIAVGSTMIAIAALVLIICAASLLPALFPLFLVVGCIYLIVKAFDSAAA